MAASALAVVGINLLGLGKDVANALFSVTLGLFGKGASSLVAALLGFVTTTADPSFGGGWWSGAGEALFLRVLAVSGSLLALAFMCSIVTAVISGDQRLLARAAKRLPLAVLEMALLVGVTGAFVAASDEISVAIAAGATRPLSDFVASGLVAAIADTGIVGLVAGGLLILAAIAVWAELLCRTALIYVAVLAGPLVFAASVHPSVNGLKRRYVEAGLALICSKIVVALAFATGAAMLSGLGSSTNFAAATGDLLEALAVLLIAAFAPFVLLKLFLGAEAIIATEGLERRPGRAVLHAAGMATSAAGFAAMVRGLGGGASNGALASDRSGPAATPPPPRPAPPAPPGFGGGTRPPSPSPSPSSPGTSSPVPVQPRLPHLGTSPTRSSS